MNVGTQTAISKQLAASYEFLVNKHLNPGENGHLEIWECFDLYKRSLRSRSIS